MTPAIEKMAHMGMHSGTDDDTAFDSSFDDVDMDAFMEVDDDDFRDTKPKAKWKTKKEDGSPKKTDVDLNSEATKASEGLHPSNKGHDAPSWLSVYDSLSVTTKDDLGPLSSSTSMKSGRISALEPDGSLRFFWLDYLELDGKIYFIGKLKDKTSSAWASCCVTITGIQRNIFVLPRQRQVEQDEDEQLCETDVVPDQEDVYNDFDSMRKRLGLKTWKGKFVKRKYAFRDPDVPREEREWLKVVYGFDGRSLFILLGHLGC
jgi:DNA polymerase alpha subunit A